MEPPLYTEGISAPPVRRHAGPIIDSHTHMDAVEDARLLAHVAADFGVRVLCGVVRPEAIKPLRRALGDAFRPIVRVDHSHVGQADRFARENVRAVREARTLGAVAAKFWYSPRFVAETHFRFDDPALRPIFETLAELGVAALVHVADPDCWFRTTYADAARYGTKADHYAALEHTLADFPGLRVIGAHFGGHPEDLGHLGRLLAAHPNFFVDTSGTKWVARELSAQGPAARAFLIERADRILFGSDLVAFRDATEAHYSSRYWVQRWMWEGDGVRPSPVPDPCVTHPDGPRVCGLNLPEEVLESLYADNARRLLGVEV